jgi:ABC-2 type transport system ATP-binding protein
LQEAALDPMLTGREHLRLQAALQGIARDERKAREQELLDRVGLSEAADRKVKGYSGGMKRRLDIALGLVHRPSVLFLDEPTTGLDPEARVAMWEEVQRLAAQESLTILLTTHYLEEADQLADRLAIVSRGRIIVEGTPEELKRGLQGELVTVELQDGQAGDAIAVVERFEGARETAADGQQVRTRVPNGARAIPALLSALEGAGIAVASVATSRPSLDDVYLHYTGREFSADDAEGQA